MADNTLDGQYVIDPMALTARERAGALTRPAVLRPKFVQDISHLLSYFEPPEPKKGDVAPVIAAAPAAVAAAPAHAEAPSAPLNVADIPADYGSQYGSVPGSVLPMMARPQPDMTAMQGDASRAGLKNLLPPTAAAGQDYTLPIAMRGYNMGFSDPRAALAAPAAVATARNVTAPAVEKHLIKMPDTIDMTTKVPSGAASSPGILSRIFSGKDYQSTGQQVVGDNGKVNWGSPDVAADFFRADKARMAQPSGDDNNYARGGAANASPTKEALLHKSLEIIHHMIRNR